jgi:hypothetical protein
MPWKIVGDHPSCPSGRPWAVVKESNGEVEGCHETREDAIDQLRALNAAEADRAVQHVRETVKRWGVES